MSSHVRIARPVQDLVRAVEMYVHGLGLRQLASFVNHAGFDGVMLAQAGTDFHFEFTYCHTHPIQPASTPEDLLVSLRPGPR
jgi:hypothetical protein